MQFERGSAEAEGSIHVDSSERQAEMCAQTVESSGSNNMYNCASSWPSEVVYMTNRSPSTDPWGTPVERL